MQFINVRKLIVNSLSKQISLIMKFSQNNLAPTVALIIKNQSKHSMNSSYNMSEINVAKLHVTPK